MISKFSNSDGQETTTHTCWGQSPLQGLPKGETVPKKLYQEIIPRNLAKKFNKEIQPRNLAKKLSQEIKPRN